MANVLQVCGVTIPSAADAYVRKEFHGIKPSDPTGIYVRSLFKFPASTLTAWNADSYIPVLYADGNGAWPTSDNQAGPTTAPDWEFNGSPLVSGDVTADVWHTLDVHYHDLSGDAKVDGNPLVTNVGSLPWAALTGASGPTSSFGTTSVPKVASAFQVLDAAVLDCIVTLFGVNGSPGDQVLLQVCDDAGGAPGTVLDSDSQPHDGSGITRFTFTGGVALSAGTTYWVVASRTGALDNTNNYVTIDDEFNALGYVYWDGAAWQTGLGFGQASIYTEFFWLEWGIIFADPVQNLLYVGEISVGTGGFGTSDLFHEDWSGGSPLGDFETTTGDLVVIPEPGTAPFSLTATPVAVSLTIPDPGRYTTVYSTMLSGSPEPITLSTGSLPTGISAVFSSNPISDDSGSSRLTFSADNTASPGSHSITVRGDDGHGGIAATSVTLYVSDMPPGIHIGQ